MKDFGPIWWFAALTYGMAGIWGVLFGAASLLSAVYGWPYDSLVYRLIVGVLFILSLIAEAHKSKNEADRHRDDTLEPPDP
jgi:hypothetical protein